MSEPSFSIIIPVYNAEDYLEECVQSALCQNFEDFEIICVNDGSTDGSAVLLEGLEGLSNKVRVIEQVNSGPFEARKKGIEHANGSYLLFLDADDKLHPNSLMILAEKIASFQPDIVFFGMTRDSSFRENQRVHRGLPLGLYEGDEMDVIREKVCEGRLNSLWGKAFSRCIFDSFLASGYSTGATMGEDLIQLLPLVDKSNRVLSLDEKLYFYRANANSLMANYRDSYVLDFKEMADELDAYAGRWGTTAVQKARMTKVYSAFSLLQILAASKMPMQKKRIEVGRLMEILSSQNADMDTPPFSRRPDIWLSFALLRAGFFGLGMGTAKLSGFIAKRLNRRVY